MEELYKGELKMTEEEWNEVEKELKKVSVVPYGNTSYNFTVVARALLLIMRKVRFHI